MKTVKAGTEELWHKNRLTIFCNFNMNCNFNCSYCINRKVRNHYAEQLSLQALTNLVDYLPQLNKDKYIFGVAGGEPSLYKHLNLFLEKAAFFLPHKHQITVNTNGSLLKKFINPIETIMNLDLQITISMHIEQYSFEKYEKILLNFPYPEKIRLKILLQPGKLKETLTFIERMKKYEFHSFIIHGLIEKERVYQGYDKEELDYLKHNSYHIDKVLFNEYITESGIEKREFYRDDLILEPELATYTGLYCMAGYSAIRVLADGKVANCFYHKDNSDFNLNKNTILEYPYITKAMKCIGNACRCIAFTSLPKWDPNYCSPPEYFKGELA